MEMTRPTTVSVLSVAAGFIRNTHDSSAENIVVKARMKTRFAVEVL